MGTSAATFYCERCQEEFRALVSQGAPHSSLCPRCQVTSDLKKQRAPATGGSLEPATPHDAVATEKALLSYDRATTPRSQTGSEGQQALPVPGQTTSSEAERALARTREGVGQFLANGVVAAFLLFLVFHDLVKGGETGAAGLVLLALGVYLAIRAFLALGTVFRD